MNQSSRIGKLGSDIQYWYFWGTTVLVLKLMQVQYRPNDLSSSLPNARNLRPRACHLFLLLHLLVFSRSAIAVLFNIFFFILPIFSRSAVAFKVFSSASCLCSCRCASLTHFYHRFECLLMIIMTEFMSRSQDHKLSRSLDSGIKEVAKEVAKDFFKSNPPRYL